MRLQLLINGTNIVLEPNIKIRIEHYSPLFNSDKGAISYPFSIPVEPNRVFFRNLGLVNGYIRANEFNGMEAKILFDGVVVFSGITEIANSVNIKSSSVTINIVSRTSAFSNMIGNMSLRDINLADEYEQYYIEYQRTHEAAAEIRNRDNLTEQQVMDRDFMKPLLEEYGVKTEYYLQPLQQCDERLYIGDFVSSMLAYYKINISAPVHRPGWYPTNVRFYDVDFSGGSIFRVNANRNKFTNKFCVNIDKPYPTSLYCHSRIATPGVPGVPMQFPAERPDSAPHFYVMAALEFLFKQLDIDWQYTFPQDSDIFRLAFFNEFPHYIDGLPRTLRYEKPIPASAWPFVLMDEASDGHTMWDEGFVPSDSDGFIHCITHSNIEDQDYYWVAPKDPIRTHIYYRFSNAEKFDVWHGAYATSKNLPDIEVLSLIKDLQNIFGIVFDYDQNNKRMTCRFISSYLKDGETVNYPLDILSEDATRSTADGVKVSFEKDEPEYNLEIKNRPVQYLSFEDTLEQQRRKTDTSVKYDERTGNIYAVKVDEETGEDPQLFEVMKYHDHKTKEYKDKNSENFALSLKPNFVPVMMNRVSVRNEAFAPYTKPAYAPYVSVEFEQNAKEYYVGKENMFNMIRGEVDRVFKQKDPALYGPDWYFDEQYLRERWINGEIAWGFRCKFMTETPAIYDKFPISYKDDDVPDGNDKYILGFMRGPGNESGIEYEADYDGEGNDAWVQTTKDDAFTADSVDNYGNVYDYNGTEPGGASLKNRMSLVLDARKVLRYDSEGRPEYFPISGTGSVTGQEMAHRGLVHTQLAEYLHLMEHKNVVTLTCRTIPGILENMDLTKRARIGDHVAFINKVAYELSADDISDTTIELYKLNK